jgi:hypothetical protein
MKWHETNALPTGFNCRQAATITFSRRLQPLAPKALRADRLRIFAAGSDETDRYQPWLLAAGGNEARLESPA